jgi:hypothetical protein
MPKLTRIELEYRIEPEMRQLCGSIFFTKSLQTPIGNITANGSFGLVDTGSKKLLVTCYHVWDGFQKARLENPDLMMCLFLDKGKPVLFAPAKPIGEDQKLDLVTFDMESLLDACSNRKFYLLNQNPAPRVKKGDVLAFIGFPGNKRIEFDDTLGIGRTPYAVLCCSSDGLRFQSDVSNVRTQPPEPKQFDGISGCPCFLVRGGRPIQLVGFATGFWMNLLFFTHARCLNLDGTLNMQK